MKTRCPDLARRTGQISYIDCKEFYISQVQRDKLTPWKVLTLRQLFLISTVFPMKPTYNPSKLRRARKFGFRKRNQTASGRKVLKSRRQKGRTRLTASVARRFK